MPLPFSRIVTVSRPRFYIYELGTYVVGVCAGALTLSFFGTLDALLFAFFFLFPANLFIYGVNDIFDYETDKLNPKKNSYEALLTPNEHTSLWTWITLTTLPFCIIVFFYPLPIILSFFTFLFFAFFYSAKPIRAKTKPLLDSFFSAGHYIATAVFGYYLAGGIDFPTLAVIAGMSWAIAMHAYSAALDIEADSQAGLQTIATFLSKNGTLYVCGVLYALAGVFSFAHLGPLSVLLTSLYLFLMFKSLRTKTHEAFFSLYRFFPILNTLVGMVLFFAVLFGRFSI